MFVCGTGKEVGISGRTTLIVGLVSVTESICLRMYGSVSMTTTISTRITSIAPMMTPAPPLAAALSLFSPGLFITVVI